MKPLAIIPSYVTSMSDMNVLFACLESIQKTTSKEDLDVLVVDDFSPARDLVKAICRRCEEMEIEFTPRPSNEGFSQTVNVGLEKALIEERDAILINADMEFPNPGWLQLMLKQENEAGTGLASIVGGLLLYPTGLIQHAGIFFSFLSRSFDHRYRFGPGDLPEARKALSCPVTGALQFIRHECLEDLGVYDHEFRMGFEDVDYCVRAWQSGRSVVYQPAVIATHHESFFRGRPGEKLARWQAESWVRFIDKHRDTSFAEFCPPMV